MTQTSRHELFDKQVRRYIYEYFVEHRQAPTIVQCAQALSSNVSLIQDACRRLAEGKALVLQNNQAWYSDRIDMDWRRKTAEEIDTLWTELGFTSPFWDLNP